ncbi:MAG: hypothetical protein OXH96_21330 [Spirochaetaceae bacterium]|nr:hypothetical protein [Spirochaetaceae bacterium]
MPPLAASLVLFSTLLHAGWNLLAKRGSGSPALFPRVLLAIAVPGLLFGLLGEWRGAALLPEIWSFLAVTGAFQAAYFLGLTMGYRSGDLSLVYPLVRALPVLLVGVFDVLRGQVPGAAGWLGLALVLAGCLLVAAPARARRADPAGTAGDATNRLRDTGRLRWRGSGGFARRRISGHGSPAAPAPRWHGAAIGWAVIAALGTVGYTVADKLAADAIAAAGRAGAGAAFRYGSWEFAVSTAYFLPLLAVADRIRPPSGRASPATPSARLPARWATIVAIAALMYVTYALVLWAFQLSWQTSYVVALRQFSIVAGVVGGALLLGEPARALRITGALVIVAGVAVITFVGGEN